MLANKSQELSRGHPDILNLQAQIDLLDKKIKEHAQGIVKAMKTDLEKIKKQEIALLKEIQKQEKILAKLNAHSINMQNLKNEERTNRDLYSYYFKRYSEMSATSHALPEARILSLAQPPSTHFMPNYFLSFSFVVVLGLFGSICVGFFIDHLDNSFKKPQEIENFYKVPVLARIPVVSAKAQSAPLIFEAGSSAFESIKKLRTELLFKISQDRRVITVISASPAEGKSTVCLNLADAFAREGKKVLLIDGDLKKPHLYKAICESHPKLFGYISGEREIKDCVVATKLDKVDLIGSDCSISSSSEFLGSLGYDNLLKYVRENYDVVIIDSPPLLPSVDSVLHIKKADILILVVRNLFSRRTEAGVVKKQLKNMKISLFGIVISHCPVERPYYYYYSRSTT
jgi:capsular exopolysaccharide synthesis family protein